VSYGVCFGGAGKGLKALFRGQIRLHLFGATTIKERAGRNPPSSSTLCGRFEHNFGPVQRIEDSWPANGKLPRHQACGCRGLRGLFEGRWA